MALRIDPLVPTCRDRPRPLSAGSTWRTGTIAIGRSAASRIHKRRGVSHPQDVSDPSASSVTSASFVREDRYRRWLGDDVTIGVTITTAASPYRSCVLRHHIAIGRAPSLRIASLRDCNELRGRNEKATFRIRACALRSSHLHRANFILKFLCNRQSFVLQIPAMMPALYKNKRVVTCSTRCSRQPQWLPSLTLSSLPTPPT
jgi:hypothetical protein